MSRSYALVLSFVAVTVFIALVLPSVPSQDSAVLGKGDPTLTTSSSKAGDKSKTLTPPPNAPRLTSVGFGLPIGHCCGAFAWTGEEAYLFGGFSANSGPYDYQAIVKVDPALGVATTIAARLPDEVVGAAAVWTGKVILIFGGVSKSEQVIEFDPETETARLLAWTVPGGRYPAAFMDTSSGYAYVISGWDVAASIYRVDPQTEIVERMNATIPTEGGHRVALEHDGLAYVIGGRDGDRHADSLFIYDPRTDRVEEVKDVFPDGLGGAAMVGLGNHLYFFGGLNEYWTWDYRIYQYDTESRKTKTLENVLPSSRYASYAFVKGGQAYVVGGSHPDGPLREILGMSIEDSRRATEELRATQEAFEIPAVGGLALALAAGGTILGRRR